MINFFGIACGLLFILMMMLSFFGYGVAALVVGGILFYTLVCIIRKEDNKNGKE